MNHETRTTNMDGVFDKVPHERWNSIGKHTNVAGTSIGKRPSAHSDRFIDPSA